MTYRRCGKSGLLLPELSLGLWHNFGHVDDFNTAKDILETAFDNGITHFDLANNYGPPPGSAEENFGKILKQSFSNYRDELIISTKAGYLMWPGPYGEWGSKKYLVASLDQSLRRMGLEYVDIFYSHRSLISAEMAKTWYPSIICGPRPGPTSANCAKCTASIFPAARDWKKTSAWRAGTTCRRCGVISTPRNTARNASVTARAG